MRKYRVKYTLEIGKQEIDFSTIVEYEGQLETEDDMNNVIVKANLFINENIHIPLEMLNEVDIEVIPSP